MQVFVPYTSFQEIARCLDKRRLLKQIVECVQIVNANRKIQRGEKAGWQNHPAVKAWRGHENALIRYASVLLEEWKNRGGNYSKPLPQEDPAETEELPAWWGRLDVHGSHKRRLMAKAPEHYSQFWPGLKPSEEYVWPV